MLFILPLGKYNLKQRDISTPIPKDTLPSFGSDMEKVGSSDITGKNV